MPPDEVFDVLVIGDESGPPFLEWADAALSSLFRSESTPAGRSIFACRPQSDLPGRRRLRVRGPGACANMFEGALALRYPQRTDLRFVRLGKPNTPIFEDAVRRAAGRRGR